MLRKEEAYIFARYTPGFGVLQCFVHQLMKIFANKEIHGAVIEKEVGEWSFTQFLTYALSNFLDNYAVAVCGYRPDYSHTGRM